MKISDLSRYTLNVCAAATILAGCGGSQSQSPAFTLPDATWQVHPAVSQVNNAIGAAGSTLRTQPAGQVKGHLYVASSFETEPSSTVQRFRIVGGVPESKPDRVYSSVGAPIAVDSHGYLYATGNLMTGCGAIGGAGVFVYGPRSRSPIRTLCIAGCGNPPCAGISSLFVDGQGYLYSGIGVRFVRYGGSWQVNVYSPGSSGETPPVQTIDSGSCNTKGCQYTLTGLAVDAHDNLHVSNNGSPESVLSFASPTTNPTQIADLTGSGIVNPSGLAVDSSNEMYVDNPNGTNSFISAYRAKANGNPPPDREISVTGEQTFGSGIATAAGLLLIPDPMANVVYAVRARKNGPQRPIWALALPSGFSPEDVKLAP
jgi:hypothetical protein